MHLLTVACENRSQTPIAIVLSSRLPLHPFHTSSQSADNCLHCCEFFPDPCRVEGFSLQYTAADVASAKPQTNCAQPRLRSRASRAV
eukprot:763429-Hanusia_phi.AAC.2